MLASSALQTFFWSTKKFYPYECIGDKEVEALLTAKFQSGQCKGFTQSGRMYVMGKTSMYTIILLELIGGDTALLINGLIQISVKDPKALNRDEVLNVINLIKKVG